MSQTHTYDRYSPGSREARRQMEERREKSTDHGGSRSGRCARTVRRRRWALRFRVWMLDMCHRWWVSVVVSVSDTPIGAARFHCTTARRRPSWGGGSSGS